MKQNRLSSQTGDLLNEVAGAGRPVSGNRGVLPGLSPARRRRRKSLLKPLIATAAVAAVALAVSAGAGGSPYIPVAPPAEHGLTSDQLLVDLVNRGLVPVKAIEPSSDDIMRDLVNRGLIPRQALDD